MSNRIQPGDVEYALATACVALGVEPTREIFALDSLARFYAATAIFRARGAESWNRVAQKLLVDMSQFSTWAKRNRAARNALAENIKEACFRAVEQRRLVQVSEIDAERCAAEDQRQAEHAEASKYFAAMQSRQETAAPVPTSQPRIIEELKPDGSNMYRVPLTARVKPSAKTAVSVPFPGDKPEGWEPPEDSGGNFAGRSDSSHHYVLPSRARDRSITLPKLSFLDGKSND